MQISAKPTNQGKIVEESANTIIVSEPAIHSSDLQMDSVSIKEKNDSTNSILDENWIQQVIQMNGSSDIYTDFIEKEWMKDHNFIIL